MKAPLGNTLGAPEVPRVRLEVSTPRAGGGCPRCTLPKCDGDARPAFAGCMVDGERNLIVLDASDVLNDAFAVGRPRIDAEDEVSSRCGHLRPPKAACRRAQNHLLPTMSPAKRATRRGRGLKEELPHMPC